MYFPRSLVQYQEPIDNIKLHAFGDVSNHGVCTAVYAVVTQASGVIQGLTAAKSRLAKNSLTIPRLELVSGDMAVSLSLNVRAALQDFNMTEYRPSLVHSENGSMFTAAAKWLKKVKENEKIYSLLSDQSIT